MFHFFKAIFYTSFRLSLPFFGKCSWFVQMVNEILWRRWPVLNFGYHIPKPWMDRFAHANNKQQLTSEKRDSLGPKLGARAFMGLSGGRACKQTWRKATWNVSAGLKQLKIAKRKVELTGKKNIKMWSWRKKMCLGQVYLEKNEKNAPWNSFRDGFFALEPKPPERKRSWIRLAFGIL